MEIKRVILPWLIFHCAMEKVVESVTLVSVINCIKMLEYQIMFGNHILAVRSVCHIIMLHIVKVNDYVC